MATEEHENVAKKQVAMSTFCRQNKPYHGTYFRLIKQTVNKRKSKHLKKKKEKLNLNFLILIFNKRYLIRKIIIRENSKNDIKTIIT